MIGTTQRWAIGAGAAMVAIAAGGVLLGVQPALSAADADDQAAQATTSQIQATQVSLAALARTAAKQPGLEVEQEKLLKSVPETLKPNTFVRRVNELAALDGVQVKGVTPGAGQAYKAPGTGATSGSTDATAAAPTKEPKLAATDSRITSANLTVIPMAVSVSGPRESVIRFTHDLQNDERLFLVSNLAMTVDGVSDATTASLTGSIYALKR